VEDIKTWVTEHYPGVICKQAYAETTFFYNPGGKRPNGVYFLTLKEKNGPNDRASNLDRPGVFRVAFKPFPKTYERLFGKKPKRPEKGKPVSLAIDFTQTDAVTPHPVYAWMGWVQVLSPSRERFEAFAPLIQESYEQAVAKLT
jgi:hypothetical protein